MMPPDSAGPEKLWKTWNRSERKQFSGLYQLWTLIPVQDNNCDDPHADLVMSKKALSLFQEDEEHGQRKTKRKVAPCCWTCYFKCTFHCPHVMQIVAGTDHGVLQAEISKEPCSAVGGRSRGSGGRGDLKQTKTYLKVIMC